jgi:Tfp pilus assembly protein PilN
MPKELSKSINLLNPSGEPTSTWDKIYHWVFSIGRYVIVAVEALVIVAFISRFILDRKNNDLKKSLDAKVQILSEREEFERKIGQLQVILNDISYLEENQFEMSKKLQDTLNNIPSDVRVGNIAMTTGGVRMNCVAPDFDTVNTMESEFKKDPAYTDVQINLTKGGEHADVEFSISVKFTSAQKEN